MSTKDLVIQERRSMYASVTNFISLYSNNSDQSLWFDFETEIKNYSTDKYEPAQRGARLTAAIKNFKTRRMMHFVVFDVLCDEVDNFDITPLTIRKLCKKLFDGRCGSQQNLVELFGVNGRTRKASIKTHDLIETLADKHKKSAKKMMVDTEVVIERMKDKYRQSIA